MLNECVELISFMFEEGFGLSPGKTDRVVLVVC